MDGAGRLRHASTTPNFDARLAQRCERAGWGHRQEDAIAWLRTVAATPLPPLDAPLAGAGRRAAGDGVLVPERAPGHAASSTACAARRLLGGTARPVLPERQLHGMLKGFADLVFEHEGRYWVLDYKSNALGAGDAAYTHGARWQAGWRRTATTSRARSTCWRCTGC